jgi:hypothetical protein
MMQNDWSLLTLDPIGKFLGTSSRGGAISATGPIFGPEPRNILQIERPTNRVITMSLNHTSTKIIVAGVMRDELDLLHIAR